MLKLLRYLKYYKKETILAPLLKMLEACFELIVPLVVSDIIDIGISTKDSSYVISHGFLMILLGAIGFTLAMFAQYFSAKAAVGTSQKIRSDIFKHINTLSYSNIDRIGTATMLTRITSDLNIVQTVINYSLRLLLRAPIIVFGAMIMAFTISWKLAIIFVVVIPVLTAIIFGIMLVTIPKHKRIQKKLDNVLMRTRENLAGIRVVRAFNHEQDEKDDYKKENEELCKMQQRVGIVSSLMNPATFLVVNVALVIILWGSGKAVSIGTLTQGQTYALINYMSQILVELVKLSVLTNVISKGVTCGGRIMDLLNEKPDIPDKTDGVNEGKDVENIIEFKDVNLTYSTAATPSLTDISFKVKHGAKIGIIGGTGSGKTSLVNLLGRFYDVSSGSVLFDGVDIKEYNTKAIRDKVAFVPQKAVLFHGSVRDNMRMANANASDEEIMKAVEIAQATDFVKDKGLDHEIEQGGKNLSGGQKQRLTIARALVKNSDILVLDDSAAALDAATDARLRIAINKECKDMTVFTVSQRVASVMHADQIIVLHEGKIAGIGKHDELYDNCEIYKNICKTQLSVKEAKSV